MTNYALKNMDAGNMKCMKDMLILEHAHRLNKVINNIISALGDQSQLGFEDARSVTLDIQEFVSYLYPWQRQILYLHLLISKNKSHPAEIAWAQVGTFYFLLVTYSVPSYR